MLSSISFISVSQSSKYRYFTSLDRFIPRYFILFDTIVNEIVSLISLSESSLLVYINATDFCILILYPATLPNSLMNRWAGPRSWHSWLQSPGCPIADDSPVMDGTRSQDSWLKGPRCPGAGVNLMLGRAGAQGDPGWCRPAGGWTWS